MKKKGNVILYVVLLITISSILLSSMFTYLVNTNKITKIYSDNISIMNKNDSVRNKVISSIANNQVLADDTMTIDGVDISITPLIISEPIEKPEGSSYYSSESHKIIIERKSSSDLKTLNFSKPYHYFIYGNDKEFTMFDQYDNSLGQSEKNGMVLNLTNITNPVSFSYNTNSSYIYSFSLDEWDIYKFNAIYKVKINAKKPMTLLIHKYDNTVKQLIIFE